MTYRTTIVPPGMENILAQKRYAPGIKVGNVVYVSGMLGRDENLNVIPEPEAQFTQLFENMKKVLETAGAGFGDIVELVGYFTHLQRDFPVYQAVRDRYLTGRLPAQTAIGISELSTPGLLLELKCVAVIGD